MRMREFNISKEEEDDSRENFHLATLIECATKVIEQDIESVYLIIRLNPETENVGGGLLGQPKSVLDSIPQILPAVRSMIEGTLLQMAKTLVEEAEESD